MKIIIQIKYMSSYIVIIVKDVATISNYFNKETYTVFLKSNFNKITVDTDNSKIIKILRNIGKMKRISDKINELKDELRRIEEYIAI